MPDAIVRAWSRSGRGVQPGGEILRVPSSSSQRVLARGQTLIVSKSFVQPFFYLNSFGADKCRLESECRYCVHGANRSARKIGPWRTIGSASRRGTCEGSSVSREVGDRSAGLGGFDTVQPGRTRHFRAPWPIRPRCPKMARLAVVKRLHCLHENRSLSLPGAFHPWTRPCSIAGFPARSVSCC
jgi:hypothetical protein